MPDVRILIGNVVFAIRAVLVCQQEGKLLVEQSARADFLNLPGGAICTGESLLSAAAREWLEETGLPAEELKMIGLVENFFMLGGRRWHELGVYFRVNAPAALPTTRFQVYDHPANWLEWVPLQEMPGLRVYPTATAELLHVSGSEFRHVLNREQPATAGLPDLRLDVQGMNVQVRVHLIYVQAGLLLTNTTPGSGFWFLPGGSVACDEDSVAAAFREFREKTGIPAAGARLVGITEGFDHVRQRQQLGLCYLMTAEKPLPTEAFPVQDHHDLVMQWVSLADVEHRPVHPQGLSRMLNVPAGQIEHLVLEW